MPKFVSKRIGQQIPLASFLENWCFGMDNDNALAGTNFNQNLFGFEIEPLELGLQLINEIRKKNYSVNSKALMLSKMK